MDDNDRIKKHQKTPLKGSTRIKPAVAYRTVMKPKSKKRFRPSMNWISEIRKYQKTTDLLIRKLPFTRLVKEITREVNTKDFRWTEHALEALQEATEAYAVELLGASLLCTIHAKRITLMQKDIQLAQRIRGR